MSKEYLPIEYEIIPRGFALRAQDERGITELRRFLERFAEKWPFFWDSYSKWYVVKIKGGNGAVRERKRILFAKSLHRHLDVIEQEIRGVSM